MKGEGGEGEGGGRVRGGGAGTRSCISSLQSVAHRRYSNCINQTTAAGGWNNEEEFLTDLGYSTNNLIVLPRPLPVRPRM